LGDSLDAFAHSEEAFSHAVTIFTIYLVQDLLSFTFTGQLADDIKTGLHLFIITDGNSKFCQTNAERERIYGLNSAGDAMCSLTDAWKSYWSSARNKASIDISLQIILDITANEH
jgi:hypothetical protein